MCVKERITYKGDSMTLLFTEDLRGTVNIVVLPDLYRKSEELAKEY